jgi:hypothetical protein
MTNNPVTGFRIDWCKARARAERWKEEVELLAEEMSRVLWYLRWKKNWWLAQGRQREDVQSDVKEGLGAYAGKQAAILDRMARRFAREWQPILTKEHQDVNWPAEYIGRGNSVGGKGKGKA